MDRKLLEDALRSLPLVGAPIRQTSIRSSGVVQEVKRRIESCIRESRPSLDLSGLGLDDHLFCRSIAEGPGHSLSHLIELNLSNNRLRGHIPSVNAHVDFAERLPMMHSLDLTGNLLEQVPSFVAHLPVLQELDLSDNLSLRSVSTESLPFTLHDLYIRNCSLESFPQPSDNLPRLQTLQLSDNNIVKIPNDIDDMQDLKVLNVADNHIEDLPLELTALPQLTKFYLHRNPLHRPIPSAFTILGDSLKVLTLNESIDMRRTAKDLLEEWCQHPRPPLRPD